MPNTPIVIIESPLAAPTIAGYDANLELARNICRIAAKKGLRPRASHIFYTQFLLDGDPDERALGIKLGLEDAEGAKRVWMVLRDGEQISRGMLRGLEDHMNHNRQIRYFRTSDNGLSLRPTDSFDDGDREELMGS